MESTLQLALIISLASLGFRAITGKGMILYFLRKPFDNSTDKALIYAMKPVLLCSTCMASVHTLIWFPIITGEFFTANLILVMLMVATLNTLIWAVVEMVQKNS
tara:strand:+ start:200 stop:511 length:312 start_codon:yes stop_codon:yes gene_type:complete